MHIEFSVVYIYYIVLHHTVHRNSLAPIAERYNTESFVFISLPLYYKTGVIYTTVPPVIFTTIQVLLAGIPAMTSHTRSDSFSVTIIVRRTYSGRIIIPLL